MIDVVAYLIENRYTTDDLGQQVKGNPIKHKIFGKRKSISSNEFFKAGQLGLKPSFSIKILSAEYHGEESVEVDGVEYTIYRTYSYDDTIELYLTEKIGE